MGQIDLFENLIYIFGGSILVYGMLLIIFIWVLVKANLSFKVSMYLFLLWSFFFSFILEIIYLQVITIVLFSLFFIGVIFDWLK